MGRPQGGSSKFEYNIPLAVISPESSLKNVQMAPPLVPGDASRGPSRYPARRWPCSKDQLPVAAAGIPPSQRIVVQWDGKPLAFSGYWTKSRLRPSRGEPKATVKTSLVPPNVHRVLENFPQKTFEFWGETLVRGVNRALKEGLWLDALGQRALPSGRHDVLKQSACA